DGRTVLLVSHQLSSVVALCSMALLLESGSLSLSAAPEEAVVRYSSQLALLAEVVPIDQRSRFLRSVTTDPLPSKPGALREFQIAVGVVEGLRVNYWISVHIVNSTGDVVAQCDSRLSGMLLDPTVEQMIGLTLRSPWLLPGSYHLDVFLCCIGVVEHTDWVCQFTVAHDSPHVGALIDEATAASPVLADFKYEAKGRLP
ncbi:MAG: hypothetical protein KGO50_15780, partial [Myxococcales bacterium]|nr:hypothetical protein [Myxococcales bacterium]